jgi:hypothetical protein
MAVNLISPGIKVTEVDQVNSVAAEGVTPAGFAGAFSWGPINEAVLITNENDLVRKMGKPTTSNNVDFLVAANFLTYGNNLKVVRGADVSTALNATSEATTGAGGTGTGLLVKNDVDYQNTIEDGSGNVGPWIAKYPGALGNSLEVSLCPSASAFESTLAGTLTVAAGGTTVTGTDTVFDDEVNVGDVLVIDGRSLSVATVTSNTSLELSTAHLTGATDEASVTRRWKYWSSFNVAPGTSPDADAKGATNDEVHIVVVDADGQWTGAKGTVLEKYELVSLGSDAKAENGGVNFYKTVINNRSNYIRWADHDAAASNWGSALASTTYTDIDLPITYRLAGGSDGSAITDDSRINAYNLFKNKNDQDISLLIAGQASTTVANILINDIADTRRDLVVTVSPERADVVNNAGNEVTDIIDFRNTLTSSTFAVIDSGWKYQYDKYNDVFIYVPLNGDIAGTMTRNDLQREPWLSPAGFSQGRVNNVVNLAFNPTQAERDELYKNSINPVVTIAGRGTVLFGDKTLTSKNTAFNRINVRRLFITLQETIRVASENTLFEFNDASTRANFVNLITPYLRSVQARRGITDFRIVCDESNNGEDIVNAGEFICDIYIRPNRSINFIQLNFVAVRSGIEFAEIA